MPPQLALFFCILLILYLFWLDRKKTQGVSKAIWIPFVWIFFSASRTFSQWFHLGTPDPSGDAMLEGNPIDRAVFTILMIAGIWILSKRRLNWKNIFIENKWVWLYFAFGAISFAWCDYPFVAFKRWVKALGTVIMVLLVLTEVRPYLALGVILRRLAFVLLPLSVLFIKYYPNLGRAYHMGSPMFTGVGLQKNALGQICLICGIYFVWNLLFARESDDSAGHQIHITIYIIVLPMLTWLLYMANSATSLVCLVVAISIFMVARHPILVKSPRSVFTLGVLFTGLFFVLEYLFDITNLFLYLLGRNPDLTTRTDIWENYLSMVRRPLVGYGFESFYSSAIMRGILESRLSAHNGYLEMYLNLGVIGLGFVFFWIASGLKKVYENLPSTYSSSILSLVLIVVVALYSWTETTFAGISNMWFLLFFAIMSKQTLQEAVH